MNRRRVAIATILVGLVVSGTWGLLIRCSSRQVWAVLSITKQDNGNDTVSVYAGPRDGTCELQASAKRVDVQRSLPRCVNISLEGDVHVTATKNLGSTESLPSDWPTDPDRRMEVTVWEDGGVSVRFMRK
jgi:hypothetical protein